ncbi:TonB-dependent receptor [Bacteroides helcogenes]|uniref:TonB-dependent receptor plug n=1 Tax=Bacteroides helcogenes (strain ATCC 35417 / DSM 20613 / JCM 6297 / CCUG 15421 / P 36-108) TaxID=693979 RepID=E6SVI8_BACT6|nr:TonB-dependent receptor [Bacteroides helcogenes]ADV42498.1 TonB-dependent receptor plug [Bacteroides helcogenes P 36-108]MDY5237741.1 TonB-dependent receptor [Bacteroides helcogenes]
MRQKLLNVCLVCLFFLMSSASVTAQNIKVTGKVIDSTNEGVPGVNVQVKGTAMGVITDIDGNYKVDVPGSKSVLVFSFIGYISQEITVGNKKVINVTLQEDTRLLDEVVVVGYGNVRKGDLTGALSSVRPDANDAAKSSSVDNLLSGKVAGLVVSSASSTPGAASSVTIRGASSLRGDNQPLYVIDNIPQASTGEFASSGISGDFQINQDPLASLNPADIEDITVLKDASSTAIYGSRGANGVILITTKKGKEGKAKVNVSANFTIANAANLLKMINLNEYAGYINSRITSQDVPFHQVGDEMRYVFNDALSKYDPNDPETYRVVSERNWQKEIYTSAFSQNYSVSLNGGTGKTTYYISAAFKDINGTVKKTGLKQGDLRANLNTALSKTVDLKLMLAGSLRQNDMMAGGNTLGGATGAVSRTALDYAPFELPADDPSLSNETRTTVFSWLNDYVDLTDDKTFLGSLDLSWKISKFLTYNLRAGGNVNINNRKRWYGLELYQGMNNNGYLATTDLNKNNFSVENILNYNTKLGAIGALDATAGVTYEDYNFLSKNVIGTKFTTYEFRENGMHMAGTKDYQQPVQKDYQLLSYLGRVNVSLLDKYLVTASLRADGSSKFVKSNRWGYFPSASLAWRMEQEEFMKDVSFVDQLKMRLSYGVTGNQSIDPYSTFSMYGQNASGNVVYAESNGNILSTMIVTNLSNNGLKWEKTASWNVGIDFGILKSRLTGTLDVYQKKTTDLLISRTLPGSAGFSSTYYNQGSLTNKGFELSLNARIIDVKDWKWNLSGTFGMNKGEIGDLGLLPTSFGSLGERVGYLGNSLGDHFGVGNIFLAGEAPGLFYGYVTDGIVHTADVSADGVQYTKKDGSVAHYKTVNGTAPKAGDVKFVDRNEDGVIDTNDLDIIGNPNPDFTYGFQTNLSWKNLTLSAAFIGVQGRDILNTGNRYINTPGQRSNNITQKAYQGMWTVENESNLYPGSTYQVQNMVMDRYVENGSYLRCEDITLNYTLPKQLIRKVGMQNASVFASVKNAFVITDYSGYNPEVNSFAFDGLRPGIDMNSYPTPRSFIFGLNITF